MSELAEEMALVVYQEIQPVGEPFVMRVSAAGEYDPITGSTTPGSVTEYAGKCVLQDYSMQESGAASLAGSDIRQSDKKITFPALIEVSGAQLTQIPEPEVGMQILAGGHSWTVNNVKQKRLAGLPLAYEIQGRR